MKPCPDCGSPVYDRGCTWCNEEAYIAQQEALENYNVSMGSCLPRTEEQRSGPARNAGRPASKAKIEVDGK